MDDSRAKDLLAEILDDGEIVRRTFSPAGDLGSQPTAANGKTCAKS